MKSLNQISARLALMTGVSVLVACDKNDRSFSILSETEAFQQSTAYSQRNIDILWVIDNSGSMANSQTNLRNNMRAFIDKFSDLGMDYRMAVIGTDAWLGDESLPGKFPNTTALYNKYPSFNPALSLFRDGCNGGNCQGRTGIYIMDPSNTVNPDGTPTNVFPKNSALGTAGSGDERAFHSIIAALENSTNKTRGFPRPGAFLQIVILSDEDDYSGDATEEDWWYVSNQDRYNAGAPKIQPVDYYVQKLDTKMQGRMNYSVSGIYIKDAACLNTLTGSTVPSPNGRTFGTRYQELVNKTSGVAGSLCDAQFYQNLTDISQNTLQLASTFTLGRQPNPDTIVVMVNGVRIAQSETNGWTYLSASNAVQFRGNAIPAQGANIFIDYDPLTAKN